MPPSPAAASSAMAAASPQEAKPLDLPALLSMPASLASSEIVKLPPASMERLRTTLWDILGTVGRKEEFLSLQRILAAKQDLTYDSLAAMPLPLGKILVAVRTGIQAFLHPSVQMSQQHLAEIFLQRRCKNMACQSVLPAGDCSCHMCSNRAGFCNLCMCVVCKKFDFETNTCRWIGCDFCLHWCHSECAIHMAHIRTVNVAQSRTPSGQRPDASNNANPSAGAPAGGPGGDDTAFCCPSCGHCSDLIGFVKDVFEMCSEQWDSRGTRAELECVRTMFGGSANARGVQLLRCVSRALQDLDQGKDFRLVRMDVRTFLVNELAKPSPVPLPSSQTGGGPSPPEAPRPTPAASHGEQPSSSVAATGISTASSAVVQAQASALRPPAEVEAMRLRRGAGPASEGAGAAGAPAMQVGRDGQVEVIFLDEDGAKSALMDSERELEEKRRELAALDEERRKRERQLEELQNVAESREADVKRLEAEAEEARKEVQVLHHIIQVKRRTAEREYEMKRGQLMMDEAETKRRRILDALERMQNRDVGRPMGPPGPAP